jgi:hypothetical protein
MVHRSDSERGKRGAARLDEAQMMMTPVQHRRLAELYRAPDEHATPEELKLAEKLAAQREALPKLIGRRALDSQ